METAKRLAERLKGANVQQVARLSGLSPKTIYRLRDEAGNSPTLDTVHRIHQALKGYQTAPRSAKRSAA